MCTKEMNEVLDRTRRLESRMVQLGDYVGANLRSKQKIEIHDADTWPTVRIDALDVSVSRIVTELRQHNVVRGEVPVYLDGKTIFTINLDNIEP